MDRAHTAQHGTMPTILLAVAVLLGTLATQLVGGPHVAAAQKNYNWTNKADFKKGCESANGVYVEGNGTVGCYNADGSKTICDADAKHCNDYPKGLTAAPPANHETSNAGNATFGIGDGPGAAPANQNSGATLITQDAGDPLTSALTASHR